jgi:hypothetical protein
MPVDMQKVGHGTLDVSFTLIRVSRAEAASASCAQLNPMLCRNLGHLLHIAGLPLVWPTEADADR